MFEYLKGDEGWCYKERLQYILSSSKNWSILAPRRGKNLPDDHDLEYLKGGRGLELSTGPGASSLQLWFPRRLISSRVLGQYRSGIQTLQSHEIFFFLESFLLTRGLKHVSQVGDKVIFRLQAPGKLIMSSSILKPAAVTMLEAK